MKGSCPRATGREGNPGTGPYLGFEDKTGKVTYARTTGISHAWKVDVGASKHVLVSPLPSMNRSTA